MELMKAGFPTLGLTETIDIIAGITVRGINNSYLTATDIADTLPSFWIEKNEEGEYCLCCMKFVGQMVVITDTKNIPHYATGFVGIIGAKNELVGGRPPVNR